MNISKKIRTDFPWFKNNPELFYFDNAATTLKPQAMINSTVEYYAKLSSNPHNTDSSFSYALTTRIEDFRSDLAKHLNVANPDQIIFTSGATESLNLFATGLAPLFPEPPEVILTTIEHSSNLAPWLNLANKNKISIKWVGTRTFPSEDEIIGSVTPSTKILSFCSSSNLFGTTFDVEKISTAVRKINPGLVIIVDATQTLPHRQIDLKKWNVDLVAASGHKMCGPTGIGIAYIAEEWLEKLAPIKFGGGMNNVLNLNTFTYASSPSKFEGGTPNVAGILGWSAAFKYLNSLGWDNIYQHSLDLKKYFDEKIAECKNIEIFSTGNLPVISFNIKNVHSQDLANYLWQNKIIVRSGLSCAKNSNLVTHAEAVVRASFYIYNDEADVDHLVETLKNFRKGSELDGVI